MRGAAAGSRPAPDQDERTEVAGRVPEPRPASSSGRSPRRAPAAIWWITVVHVLLLLGYSVAVPTFRAPDEYMHVDLALRVAGGGGYPEYDGQRLSAAVLAARDTSPAYTARTPPVGAAAAVDRAERPSFATLDAATGGAATELVNQMPQHPPLYYGLAGGVLALLDRHQGAGDWPFDRTVAALRLLGVVLVAPLPVLAWAASRRLGAPDAVGVTAAGLLLCVPSLTHIGSVVSNDDLLALLGGVLAVLLVRVLTGDRSWGTALGSGYVLGLALLTKGFALAFVPWLVLAYAVALVPTREWGALARRAGVALAVAFAIGGWWWARNLVVHGVLLPQVGLRDRVPVEPDVSEYLARFADRFLSSFWGSFGWHEATLAWPVVVGASAVLAVALAASLVAGGRRAHAALLFPAGLLAALIAGNAWRAYLKTGEPYASQGRYLFGALVALVVAAAGGSGVLPARARRFLPAAVLGAAAVLHVAAIAALTARFWSGGRIGALLAFSPWPPVALAVVLGALGLAGCALAWTGRPAAWRELGAPVQAPAGAPVRPDRPARRQTGPRPGIRDARPL